MSLDEIKTAIQLLAIDERDELRAWLQEFTDDDWDRQMEADANAGRLDRLISEAIKRKKPS